MKIRLLAFFMAAVLCIACFAACDVNVNPDLNDNDKNKTTEAPENETNGAENGTNAPEGGETTAPEGGETTAPEGGETTAPEGGETNAPEGGETNAPEGGETNAPEDDDTNAPENPPATEDKGYDGSAVTITFYHTMGSNLSDVLNIYIEEFNELYPNITIRHEQVGGYDDVREQISTEITVGNQPNIAYCYPDHVAIYNVAKAVVTLDSLIDNMAEVTRADGTEEIMGLTTKQINDFIPGFYNEGKQFGDGKMYTLPLSKSTEVLYYNADFFAEHNLTPPKTWDEMEALCARIKEIDPDCIPLGYDSESNWFITMCEQLGTPYTSATGEHFLFNTAENRAFVAEFREWFKKGYVTTQEIYGAYTSGLFVATEGQRSYMSISSSAGSTHQRPKNGEFQVGITTIPQANPENPKVISKGPSLCIFDKANKQEVYASWLFMKFLTTNVDFQAEFSMASGYVPVLKSVVKNKTYKTKFLDKADGGNYISALSAKVCMEQTDAYYTSPAFNGSSEAKDQVAQLIINCLQYTENDTNEYIDMQFEKAITYLKKNFTYTSNEDTEDLVSSEILYAKDYVKLLYKWLVIHPETVSDYELISRCMIAGVPYNIIWTSSSDKVVITKDKDNLWFVVDVDERAEFDLDYVLTATIIGPDGETVTLSFELFVPKFRANTFAEYAAAAYGTQVAVQGIITGVFSKSTGSYTNGLYIQDEKNEGGYYVYNLADDPNGVLLPGMTVLVCGEKDFYSGTYEIINASVQIVDSDIKEVTPVDYTEIFATAETLNDAALVEKQGMLVTIKSVIIQEAYTDSGYYYFQLGNLITYLRISSINNATSTDVLDIIKAVHEENYGNFADVIGVISVYNGNFYLSPVSADAISNIVKFEKTDAEKIDFEISGVTVDAQVNLDTVLYLPTTGAKYGNVTITWTSDNACAVVEGGRVTITLPEEETKVTLTAVYAIGETTKAVTYEIAVAAATPLVVPPIVTSPEEGTAYKLFLTQNNLNNNFYFTGEMSSYYFQTVANYEEGVDVFVEVVDGGYRLYFMKDEEKAYISVVRVVGDDGRIHNNVVFNAETPSVFEFNTEYNMFTTEINENTYFIGTCNSHNTISAYRIEMLVSSPTTYFAAHLTASDTK